MTEVIDRVDSQSIPVVADYAVVTFYDISISRFALENMLNRHRVNHLTTVERSG